MQTVNAPAGPTGATRVVNYSFSQPGSIFVPSPGLFTVTNSETQLLIYRYIYNRRNEYNVPDRFFPCRIFWYVFGVRPLLFLGMLFR